MKPVFIADEHGMALIESAAALVFVIAFITMALTCMYASFARVWIARCSYEAAICLSTSASELSCKNTLRAAVTRMLPFGSASSPRVSRDAREAHVSLDYTFGEKLRIHHSESLKLPLVKSGGS